MQRQEIIEEGNKCYLVIAIPTTPELLHVGFVSKSQKSFVFRTKDMFDKDKISQYKHVRLDPDLIKNRLINSVNFFRQKDVITHEFKSLKDIGCPSIKISVSKDLKTPQRK